MKQHQALPTIPKQQLTLWGKMFAVARHEKQWRQIDVAERLGVTRQTIARIERGDPSVAIGYYMTLAWLLNIPMLTTLDTHEQDAKTLLDLLTLLQSKLPKRIQKKTEKSIDDNF